VMVEHECQTGLPQIIVEDTRLALAELAGFWRRKQNVKLVGVTGSNGKTTTKEMVTAILNTQGKTLSTQGNLNNDIGVPLTLLRLDESHQYAVIEMGANHAGEIAYTSHYASPDVSIITNVGSAHLEGFGDLDGIAKAKGEIIASLNMEGVGVLNRDDTYYDFWLQTAGQRKTCSFGLSNNADVFADNIKTVLNNQGFMTRFELRTATVQMPLSIALAGEHNVKNALAAIAATMQFGIDPAQIKSGLEQIKPVKGRMQFLLGRKGNVVINDSYNANPSSLEASLDVLDKDSCNWLVLGAFGELGENSSAIHREMGVLIKSRPVQRLFATGELARHTVESFGAGGEFFDTQEKLIAAVTHAITGKETLLIKGSRAQKMENVVAALVDNFRAE